MVKINVLIVEDVLNGHSGTTKLMINMARGFKRLNYNVLMIFFGETDDSINIKDSLKDINYYILKFSHLNKIEYLVHLYLSFKMKNINIDDIAYITNEFKLKKFLKKIKFSPDFIIMSNFISAFFLINYKNNSKKILILHEAPLFDDFNRLLRFFLLRYIYYLNKKTDFLSISSEIKNKTLKNLNINSSFIFPVGFDNINIDKKKKDNFILIDTRWTDDRDPFFIIDILKNVDSHFIFHGYFPDNKLKNSLIEKIKSLNLINKISVISGLSDEELNSYYKKSKIVLRWSGIHESGNSVSTINAITYECIPVIDNKLGFNEFLSKNISNDIVVKRDPDDFSIIINKILNDDELYNYLQEKIKTIKKIYTWERICNEILNIKVIN